VTIGKQLQGSTPRLKGLFSSFVSSLPHLAGTLSSHSASHPQRILAACFHPLARFAHSRARKECLPWLESTVAVTRLRSRYVADEDEVVFDAGRITSAVKRSGTNREWINDRQGLP